MSENDTIKRVAAQSFAEHLMEDAPSRSWRLAKPGTGFYAFRVTWAPGMLAISGDIGTCVYEVWPAFQTVNGAVSLVSEAHFDYLAGKSQTKQEVDQEATVQHLLQVAYDDLRGGSRPRLFKLLCDEYGGDHKDPLDRKEAARAFRDDQGLTAERVYNITGDFEAPSYSFPSAARWAFEAVKLWAAKMRSLEADQASAA